jgi:uncharacterized membrane protein YedE/YeeE
MSESRPSESAPHPRAERYMNPYLAGIGLGVSLLAGFVLVGRGLGASGAFTRLDAAVVETVAPNHAHTQSYWKRYTTQKKAPLDNFLVFQVLGMIFGGLVSGYAAGRIRKEVYKGPRISTRWRLVLAAGGGVLAGFGARLAGGCTSGLALTGGATLAISGWVFMMCFFGAGFAGAALVRRQWR